MTTKGREATPQTARGDEASTSTRGAGPKHSQAAQTPAPTEPASPESAGGGRSVSVWAVLALLAGAAILVVAAINLPNLPHWGDEHGNLLVFLAFFLVMSIGGRWFWTGIDAVWAAIRGRGN